MKSIRNILSLVAIAALAVPATARSSTSFTPSAHVGGRVTDNAGDRPEEMGARSDVTANAALGGRMVISQPIWSIRAEGLGEYERYLSAGVRNTWASGGLDGRWRPDERTYVRSTSRASYAPDRFDPRVPYRVALAAEPGEQMAPFIRATTTRWSEALFADRRITENARLRGTVALSGTKYTDRKLAGPAETPIDARLLQSRTVMELGGESLWAAREDVEAGVYVSGARADYEKSSDAYTASTGGVVEWRVQERLELVARTGPTWTAVPDDSLPERFGYTGELALTRLWTLAELELSAKEGVYLADATTPAARRRQGRVTFRAQPFERLTTDVYAGAGWERSQYAAYHATGTSRILTAGAGLGYRLTQYLTARAGYEHNDLQVVAGRNDLPYRSNVFFVGVSFTDWSLGSPAPEAVAP